MAERTWSPDGSTLILLDKQFPQTEGGSMRVCGHVHFGPFPEVGETAVIEGKEGGVHYFRFTSVKPCADPEAMYFADLQRYRVEYEGETIWQEPGIKSAAKGINALMARVKSLWNREPPHDR